MMCNIWQSDSRQEISPSHYAKLPRTLRTINITGGEPFLRKDLVDVVRAIHSVVPRARIVFSTNGFMTGAIVARVKEIREFHDRIGVGVSIDGRKAVHDRVRGVPGAFDKAVATVDALKGLGLKDLRIAMTVFGENGHEVEEVFRLSKRLGVEFTMTLAHDSEIYFQKSGNLPGGLDEVTMKGLSRVMHSQLRSPRVKEWFRAYHTKGMMDPSTRESYKSGCEAGARYFFVAPNGDVYPCNVMDLKIGNLAEVSSWDELFTPAVESRVRRAVKGCDKSCWMVCNTRSLILAHPTKVGAWVSKSKVKAHLARRSED